MNNYLVRVTCTGTKKTFTREFIVRAESFEEAEIIVEEHLSEMKFTYDLTIVANKIPSIYEIF